MSFHQYIGETFDEIQSADESFLGTSPGEITERRNLTQGNQAPSDSAKSYT